MCPAAIPDPSGWNLSPVTFESLIPEGKKHVSPVMEDYVVLPTRSSIGAEDRMADHESEKSSCP